MKKFLMFSFMSLSFSLVIFASEYNLDITTNIANKYLWRGQKLYDKLCIQPNLNLYLKNFIINYWASYCINKSDYIESDFTFIASDTMPYLDIIKLNAGFIIYTFPNNSENLKNSLEIFGAINFDMLMTPYIKLFYDSVLGKGYYIETGISYSIGFAPFNLNLYATTGYNFNQWGYLPAFSVLLLTPELTYSFNNLNLILSSNIQIALNEQYQNDYIINFGIKYTYK